MSDRRTMKHWVIKVNGSTKADVGPGENVEIGRRPIRPVADDGHRRLEINDKSRSVSKRHALFAVAENGGASITDLNSTNGSYVVNGEGLRRLEPNKDFIFPDSPMRLQFGDVPVDFVRIETEESGDGEQQVSDLFDYASSGAGNPDVEPHMASMSVDDILNLRAGEPTTAFSASDVATRLQRAASSFENEIDESSESVPSHSVDKASVLNEKKVTADDVASEKRSESGTMNPNEGRPVDRISLNVMGPETQAADVKARDLFKDAMENGLGNQTAQGVDAAQAQSASQLGETVNPVAAEKSVIDLPPKQKSAKQDSSIASRRDETQARSAAQPVQTQASVQTVAPQQKGNDGVANGVDSSAPGNDGVRTGAVQHAPNLGEGADSGRMVEDKSKATASNDQQKLSPFSRSEAGEVLFVPMEENSTSGAQRGDGQNTVSTVQTNVDATAESNTERNKFMRPVMSEADGTLSGQATRIAETQAFKPTFEPGSVFEKVSNGEFQQKAPEVEVEGMSSDEAKQTTDFSKQFEMAKHPQLLPFLAMNPSLYGDLYEWLSAIGNDDVDAALANNSGYNEYRNKAAEGREQQ
ncbi:FHA domain-containing protein [Bifidobacterium commune]|uniref:FHA domain-containing protein n=1 Tax=Bifidobacterium commune TaxID=1505727 RepID=A0A1C4H4G7_9BIFI|nr:FHA domain-containing protein [Bifidobacterium commune]SCC79859.1 FHA domain-containing protein [Bifidobacterium commune]